MGRGAGSAQASGAWGGWLWTAHRRHSSSTFGEGAAPLVAAGVMPMLGTSKSPSSGLNGASHGCFRASA